MEPDRDRLRELLTIILTCLAADGDRRAADPLLLRGELLKAGFEADDLAELFEWLVKMWPLPQNLDGLPLSEFDWPLSEATAWQDERIFLAEATTPVPPLVEPDRLTVH